MLQHRNKSVDVHQFAMVPRADIPRSAFMRQQAHKTTFDAGYLVPFYVDEVLPGDSFSLSVTAFARMATPVFPIMDNMRMSFFFFFVPNRLIWSNWKKFMGEQDSPADSISYVVPTMTSPNGGYAIGSLHDYMGLPTVGQVGGGVNVKHASLHLRAYNRIYQDWFKDQNLQNAVQLDVGDGPDTYSNYVLRRRGKRHDYFTSALPWPQKGGTSVSLPLGTSARVKGDGWAAGVTPKFDLGSATNDTLKYDPNSTNTNYFGTTRAGFGISDARFSAVDQGLYADLSTATAATINQLRQAFQIQKLLERDARGGTRYTEIVKAHFGVTSPDARLQRPEYLGGGSAPVIISPITQNTQTGLTGGSSPMGTLAGVATTLGRSGFTQSFTEHGVILGLVSIQADLSYQQGMRRMWSRSTRYDFYFPAFAMLGEQSILNKEIYCVGSATGGVSAGDQDMAVFGYQERWAELRYLPSLITGKFRSTAAGTLDAWHLAQKFTALPTLNDTFIQDTPPVSRVVAAGAAADGQQFLFDSMISCRTVRPMPMYSVPGLIDHF